MKELGWNSRKLYQLKSVYTNSMESTFLCGKEMEDAYKYLNGKLSKRIVLQ